MRIPYDFYILNNIKWIMKTEIGHKGNTNGTIQRIYKPSDRRTVGSARYRKQIRTAACLSYNKYAEGQGR